jgi:hypothetical protein
MTSSNQEAHYGDVAQHYNQAWFYEDGTDYQRWLVQSLMERLQTTPSGRVVDLGGGTGNFSAAVAAVLFLLLLPSAQAFFPHSPTSASPTTAASPLPQPGLGVRLANPTDTSVPNPRAGVRVLFIAATDSTSTGTDGDDEDDWVESPCPCTEIGQGSSAAGPLTDRCDIGDVVVLVLPPFLPGAPSPLALAVVDGPKEACLLCMRDPDCPEWYRDYRDEVKVLTDVSSAALVRVINDAYYSQRNIPSNGGGVGYGADAVDCWWIDEEDLPEGLGRPLDFVQNAPWMFLG